MTTPIRDRRSLRTTEEPTKPETRRMPVIAKIFASVVMLGIAIHTVLVATWVAPSNQISQAIGHDRLTNYIQPFFTQNWSIFAPNPWSTDVIFEVRAAVADPQTGEVATTDWANLTAGENTSVLWNVSAPRTAHLTRRTVDSLHSARDEMTDGQLDWIETDFQQVPLDDLETALLNEDNDETWYIDEYMAQEVAAVYIATAYAQHTWDGEIQAIQISTGTREVPDYEDRHTETLDEVEPDWYYYGWRQPAELTDEELELFTQYLVEDGSAQ